MAVTASRLQSWRPVRRVAELGSLGPSWLALKTNALALKSPIELGFPCEFSRAIRLNSTEPIHYTFSTLLLANLLAVTVIRRQVLLLVRASREKQKCDQNRGSNSG